MFRWYHQGPGCYEIVTNIDVGRRLHRSRVCILGGWYRGAANGIEAGLQSGDVGRATAAHRRPTRATERASIRHRPVAIWHRTWAFCACVPEPCGGTSTDKPSCRPGASRPGVSCRGSKRSSGGVSGMRVTSWTSRSVKSANITGSTIHRRLRSAQCTVTHGGTTYPMNARDIGTSRATSRQNARLARYVRGRNDVPDSCCANVRWRRARFVLAPV